MRTILAVLVLVLMGLMSPMGLRAEQGSLVQGSFTIPTTLVLPITNGVYNVTNTGTAVTLKQGCPLSITCSVMPNLAGTSGLTNGFDLYDGTQWTTTQPIRVGTAALAGATNVVFTANFTAATLAGYTSIRPASTMMPTGAQLVTNLVWSYCQPQ